MNGTEEESARKKDQEFGLTFHKKAGDLPNYNRTRQIKVSYSVYSDSPIHNAKIVYAVAGTVKDTLYEYKTESINGNMNQWANQEAVFNVRAQQWQSDWQIKIYPWNPDKETFFIDDDIVLNP